MAVRLLHVSVTLYMCIYTRASKGAHVCMPTEAKDQQPALLKSPSIVLFRKQVTEILLSLPPQCWDHRHALLSGFSHGP